MTQEHPITPPPELTQEWSCDCPLTDPFSREFYVATQAARWGADQQLKLDAEQINQAWQKGADQELEACCEWLDEHLAYENNVTDNLRAARRPKPPSLKERALQAWAAVEAGTDDQTAMAVIRRALEALPE